MSNAPLTAAAVENFRPGPKRRIIRDHGAKSLFLVIEPTGHKSWRMRFRTPSGRIAKLTLGPYDRAQELVAEPVVGQPLTLAAARQLASSVHRQRALGRDVIADRQASKHRARIESETLAANTFSVAARNYIEEHAKSHARSWRKIARQLGLDYPLLKSAEPIELRGGLAERWADKLITDIDEHAIWQVVEEAKRVGVPGLVVRNKGISTVRGRALFIVLSAMFGWLKRQRHIKINPCSGISRPSHEGKRERVLSNDEIRIFWDACETVDQTHRPLFAPILKLMLLTGARENEVAGMRRDELIDDVSANSMSLPIFIEGGLWHLPGSRAKNKKPLIVHLPPLMRELIASRPVIGDFVFTTTGTTPVSGWSRLKRRLDAIMLSIVKKERGASAKLTPWQLRDLRRTFVTGMGELGIAPHVIELCVNHISGHRAGVAGVYNRSELLPERKAALERWAVHVAGIVSKQPSNVVPLPRGAA